MFLLSIDGQRWRRGTFRQSLRESITVVPILSDIDILVNGGLELEEVEIEIKATDEAFVPTTEGKSRFYWNTAMKLRLHTVIK